MQNQENLQQIHRLFTQCIKLKFAYANNGYIYMYIINPPTDSQFTYDFVMQRRQLSLGDTATGGLASTLPELAVLVGEHDAGQGQRLQRRLASEGHGCWRRRGRERERGRGRR